MPVNKKRPKKKPEKKTKKAVRKALDQLPGLIVEQAMWKKDEKKLEKEKKIDPNIYYQEQKHRKKMLWIAVAIFTGIILVMWGWNAYVSIQDLTTYQEKETGILDQTKKNLQEVFDSTDKESIVNEILTENEKKEENSQNQDIEKKIKENLSTLLTKIKTTSTTSSTTKTDIVSSTEKQDNYTNENE